MYVCVGSYCFEAPIMPDAYICMYMYALIMTPSLAVPRGPSDPGSRRRHCGVHLQAFGPGGFAPGPCTFVVPPIALSSGLGRGRGIARGSILRSLEPPVTPYSSFARYRLREAAVQPKNGKRPPGPYTHMALRW